MAPTGVRVGAVAGFPAACNLDTAPAGLDPTAPVISPSRQISCRKVRNVLILSELRTGNPIGEVTIEVRQSWEMTPRSTSMTHRLSFEILEATEWLARGVNVAVNEACMPKRALANGLVCSGTSAAAEAPVVGLLKGGLRRGSGWRRSPSRSLK